MYVESTIFLLTKRCSLLTINEAYVALAEELGSARRKSRKGPDCMFTIELKISGQKWSKAVIKWEISKVNLLWDLPTYNKILYDI